MDAAAGGGLAGTRLRCIDGVGAIACDYRHADRAVDDPLRHSRACSGGVPLIKSLLKGDVAFTNFECTIVDEKKGQSP